MAKRLTLWACELCNKEYESKQIAEENCENIHVTDFKLEFHYSPRTKFPEVITLSKTNDDGTIERVTYTQRQR